MKSTSPNQLCLKCGLCCNGVIFATVRLQPADDATRLRALGLGLTRTAVRQGERQGSGSTSERLQFHQPCAAFDGCRCRIYEDRPVYCRHFDCLLLKSAQAGEVTIESALRLIRKARRSADRVKRLLAKLGDTDDQIALSVRFRRMKRRIESGNDTARVASDFGELTLAMHDLNVLLSERFYSVGVSH